MSALTTVLFSPLPVNERSEAKLEEITDQSAVTSAVASRRTALWKASVPLRAACRGPSVMWAIRSEVQLPEHLLAQQNAHSLPQWLARESWAILSDSLTAPGCYSTLTFLNQSIPHHWQQPAQSNPPEIACAQSAQMSLCLCVRARIISSDAIIERAFTCQIVY